MMPRYLIHVGPHKTGTTYLQLRFDAARDQLRRGGVVYPSVWSSAEDEPSHRKLVVGLRESREAELRSEFEIIERNDPEYVLLSAEGINHLARPALALLKTLLGSHPVTIVFYCRRWSELLPSFWQEEIKHGYDKTFPKFLSANLADPFESDIMNFGRRLEIYAAVFGRENIKLVSYSNLCDGDLDLAGHFFDTFLPDYRSIVHSLPAISVARPNKSLPALEVEVIRALNSYSIRDGVRPPDSTLRNWYTANVGRFDLADMFSIIQANKTTLTYSDAGGQRLQKMLFEDYGDLIVPPAHPKCLFEPRQAEIVFFQQHYLTSHSARKALDELYASFRSDRASTVKVGQGATR